MTRMIRSNDLYEKIIEEAEIIKSIKDNQEIYIKDRISSSGKEICRRSIKKNKTLEEALNEIEEIRELITRKVVKFPDITYINKLLNKARYEVLEEMKLSKCGAGNDAEIKNTNGDTAVKANKDGIAVTEALKTNQEQDQEMGVINYLPATFTGANFAPEFIEQVTKEVIKKMKEDHISFGKIQLPSGQIVIDGNKITSNAGSSVIMDKEGVVTAKVGDTSVTTTKEEMICKVDNKTSNTEDIEVNKEKDSEAFSITANIKIPEIIQELVDSYVESLETMSKAMKEAEEKANCEIEALKGEVNSLKAENDKLKEQIKNDVEIDTKFFKDVSRYFKECKGEQLEKIYDREQVALAKMIKILKETNTERATVLLNVLTKIIPALSIIK